MTRTIIYRIFGVLLFLLLFSFTSYSQEIDMSGIEKKMSGVPPGMTSTTDMLSGWISENFTTDREKVSAVFAWLAMHVSYDAAQMNNTQYYKSPEESVTKTLATRKGVCQGYANVFTELCQKMNIPAWTVAGYTRQFGQVVQLPHAWNAVIIGELVYLYDPTWGAGYVMEETFTAKYNLDYFEKTPEQMRPSHMPFDPLWQFSNQPISPKDFDTGGFKPDPGSPFFNFRDTLAQYVSRTAIEQSMARLRRIEQFGITNDLVATEVSHLKTEISIYRQNDVINQLNAAVLNFNEGVNLFNQYISFKNKHFKPVKPDQAIKMMIDNARDSLLRATNLVHGLEGADPGINDNIRKLEKSIRDTLKRVKEEEAFVSRYLASKPEVRKKMFYQ